MIQNIVKCFFLFLEGPRVGESDRRNTLSEMLKQLFLVRFDKFETFSN
jgi:hypothetical protein